MKEPVPPPSLVEARTQVNDIIARSCVTEEAAHKVRLWHTEVKKWEDADDLKTAFDEGRLTFRSMSHPGGAYDYGKTTAAERKKVLGIINNDNYDKPITNKAQMVDEVWQRGASYSSKPIRLDAGGAGLLRRCDPKNFLKGTTEFPHSSKFRLGLHALSACLLNPDGYVLKRYEDTVLIALMPLPLPEDVKIFYQLRKLAKTGGSPGFTTATVVLASEFTRPQLASSLDMGTIYTVVVKQRKEGEKTVSYSSVKYVRGENPTTPDSAVQCRLNATEDYRRIVSDKANEITIAYRKHGNLSRFPIFAAAFKGQDDYVELNVTLPVLRPMPKFGGSELNKNQYAGYQETGFVIRGHDFSRWQRG